MRLYCAVLASSFRRYSTYRAATVAGAFTNSVFGCIKAIILISVFSTRPSIQGWDVTDAVSFAFLSQSLLMPIGVFGWGELAERVTTGDIVADLYRPADLQAWWAAVFAGKAAFQFFARGAPPAVAGALLFSVRFPHEADHVAAVAAVCVGAVGVAYGLQFIVEMSAFWFTDVRGTSALFVFVTLVLSGVTVPLIFFPDPIQDVLRVLPPATMIQLPIEVALGTSRAPSAGHVLVLQAFWTVALGLVGRWVLARATHRVVVQGG